MAEADISRWRRLEKERKKAMRQAMKLKVADLTSLLCDVSGQEQPVNNQDTEKEKEKKEQLAEREEKVSRSRWMCQCLRNFVR